MAITMIYPVGSGSPTTLTLPGSNYEEPSGYLPSADITRAVDGTLRSYVFYLKRKKSLKWDYLTPTQKAGLETLYAYGGPFTFADTLDTGNQFVALMMAAPDLIQIGKNYWEGSVEVQEI